jgi:hypothetical protein
MCRATCPSTAIADEGQRDRSDQASYPPSTSRAARSHRAHIHANWIVDLYGVPIC